MPAAPLYRLKSWDETFENKATRKLRYLTRFQAPIDFGSTGYGRIMREPEPMGEAVYGVWMALIATAATCTPRGTLRRSDGTPHTPESIADRTRMRTATVTRAWEIFIEMGWLVTDRKRVTKSAPSAPHGGRQGEPRVRAEDGTGQDRTGQEKSLAPASGATAGSGAVVTEATERTADPLAASEPAASPVEAVEPAQPTRAKPRRCKPKSDDEPGEAVERDRPPERGESEATERPVRSDHKRVIEAYFDAYRERLGRKPVITGREAKVVREMLDGGLSGDEIIAALPAYLDLSGWEAEQGWPLWALPGAWNKLQAGRSGGKPGSSRSVADSIRDTFAKLGGK